MVTLKNISKSYGSKLNRIKVLDEINLIVNNGDFAVILGPSGSGINSSECDVRP